MSNNPLIDISKVYMEEIAETAQTEAYTVTRADKEGNTPAYQGLKAGKKNVKTGKPLYKAADHLKDDKDWGYDKDGNSLNPADIEAKKRKKDKLFGSPNKKVKKEAISNWREDLKDIVEVVDEPEEKAEKEIKEKKVENKVIINPNFKEAVKEIGGELLEVTELSEKDKDTPDQVKAVIAYDKARKGTRDATYDTEHGDKKQAKKERDYAKWQRDQGAEFAQKSGQRWKRAPGSTREKEGKKSVTHAQVQDSYDPQREEELWYGVAERLTELGEMRNVQYKVEGYQRNPEIDEGALVKAAQGVEAVGGAVKKGVKAFNKADRAVTKATVNRVVKPVAKAAGRALVGGVKGAVKGALNREGYQRNPEKGEEEERKAEKRRKESGAMPPRGDKRREDFERWYAANVR